MIIIPYIYSSKTISNKQVVHTFNVLCEGGQTLWQESCSSVQKALAPNDLFAKNITKHKMNNQVYYFVEIDAQKTEINSMYAWNELLPNDSDTLCWRKFYIFTNIDNTPWLKVQNDSIFNTLSVILKTCYSISI
jgi:hypothetical protein